MVVFNPYDLNHIALLNKWSEQRKKGLFVPCPFVRTPRVELTGPRRGILKPIDAEEKQKEKPAAKV